MATSELTALSLFSGYGGIDLGLQLAGLPHRVVGYVERESHAAAVLLARMEDEALDPAPVWCGNVEDVPLEPLVGVDIIHGGFPCQPWSSAGRQGGVDDDRWLWPSIARLARALGPRYVFLENVPGLNRRQDGGGLAFVLQDLADLGFDAEWGLLSAAAVGAPHKRERFWLLAEHVGHPDSPRRPEVACGAHGDEGSSRWSDSSDVADGPVEDVAHRNLTGGGCSHGWPPAPDDELGWQRWISEGGPEPSVRRSTDGRPVGLAESLHLGGNGAVPQVAAAAFLELRRRLSDA